MKKIIAAAALLCALACGRAFAAENIDGVWGIRFGAARDAADAIMTKQHGAVRVCEYGYVPGYHEAFYKVNFFGRSGHLLLRFSKKGLFLARFAFDRKGTLESAQKAAAARNKNAEKKYAAFTGHFNELNTMLTKKYGQPSEELVENDVVCGYEWSKGVFSRQSITLFEDRSLSGSDTVLSYEDSSRR